MILSQLVDPVFGRYAVLLSIIAGVLELVPIIGPIIAAVPAVLLAATAGPIPVVAALALYLLVQQVENNLLVPKIQGDAVELHPAIVMSAIIIGGVAGGPARRDPGPARHRRRCATSSATCSAHEPGRSGAARRDDREARPPLGGTLGRGGRAAGRGDRG